MEVGLGEEKGEPKEVAEEEILLECSKCNRPIPKNTRFCRECGAAQTKDAFLLLLGGCVLIVACVTLVWYLTSPYPLMVRVLAPVFALIVVALVLSFVLWR